MKKGLLTLLTASLLFVGCQNYDDQFDDLNAQISALKSQVDGLASLSGQVASLSGSISGLQAGVTAAQAAATAAGASADAATAAATAAGATASLNATAIAAATAAATAAGASADAATAAAEAATTAATEAVASGASNATAIAAATAAATAAGVSADAATAAAEAATAAASSVTSTDLSGLETSLASLAAEVTKVQTSLATAATASAVTTLQTEIDAIEVSLKELLATSNVYNKDLTISSSAGLDAAVALGNNLNIINGTVTINQTTAMDATELQTVIDKIFTVTGNYTYAAAATGVTAMTFDNLASVSDLTLTVNGPISLKALVSAGDIDLKTTYTSKITSVDLDALITVTDLQTGGTSDQVHFTSATDVQLGSLANYPGAGSDYGLSIRTKKGATLDISSLDDVSSAGAATDIDLTLQGPKDVNISNIVSYSGSITATDVETLTLAGFKGVITINSGVENIDITGAEQFQLSSATDLEDVKLDILKASDPDLSATLKGAAEYAGPINAYTGETPDLTFSSMADLTSVELTGYFGDLAFTSLSDLTSVKINATFNDLSVSNNDNLTSFVVTGSTFNDITTFTGNDAITSLILDHTTGLAFNGNKTSLATSSDDNAVWSVTSNAELVSLTIGANKARNVTVTGNAKLTTVDFSTWDDLGTAKSTTDYPYVHIYSNLLTASKAQDTDDGATQYSIDGTNDASDKGEFTTTSGMETLEEALTAIQAVAKANAAVHFDVVSTHTIDTEGAMSSEDAGEQNSGNATLYTDQSSAKSNWVGAVFLNTISSETNATAYSAVAAKRAYAIKPAANRLFELKSDAVDIFNTSADTYGGVLLTGSNAVDLDALKNNVSTTRASVLGITMDLTKSQNPTHQTLAFYAGVTSASGGSYENYTTNQVADKLALVASYTAYHPVILTTYDKFTLKYGNETAITVTLTANEIGADGFKAGLTAVTTLTQQLVADWDAKYSTGQASSALSFWTTPTLSSLTIAAPSLKSSLSGSRATGQTLVFTWTPATAAQASAASNGQVTMTILDWMIGSTVATTDNSSVGSEYILTLEEAVAGSGVLANTTFTLDGVAITHTGFANIETPQAGILSTTLYSYGEAATATDTTNTIYWADARGDVVNGQAAFEGITTGDPRATFSRIHWLVTS